MRKLSPSLFCGRQTHSGRRNLHKKNAFFPQSESFFRPAHIASFPHLYFPLGCRGGPFFPERNENGLQEEFKFPWGETRKFLFQENAFKIRSFPFTTKKYIPDLYLGSLLTPALSVFLIFLIWSLARDGFNLLKVSDQSPFILLGEKRKII